MKFFSYIYKGEIRRASNQKVIPREEFSELLEATEVLEKAQREAQEFLSDYEKKGKSLAKKAKEKGYQEGLFEFNKHVIHFEQRLKEIRHELQNMVLPLALKAAKKIVGKELEANPGTIVDIVIQTIKPVLQNHHVKIIVNKADKELLEAKKSTIREMLDQVETFSIEERSDISPGGCMIETESGIINASLENQWRALESAFEIFMKRTP